MTDEMRYNIIFEGEVTPGAARDAVRGNLARLFRISDEKAEALFSGQRVVVKKGADQATAMKFRAALKQAGAQCRVEPVADQTVVDRKPESMPAAPSRVSGGAGAPASSAGVPAAATQGDLETVGTLRTGGTGFTGAFTVAEAGSRIGAEEGPAPEAPDTSHMSLAPAGAPLEELRSPRPAVNPDISHLSLSD